MCLVQGLHVEKLLRVEFATRPYKGQTQLLRFNPVRRYVQPRYITYLWTVL